ncbi:MAG: CBS domain-containing protein [Solirubrobacteraceae bacterium]|nr:CBS domain-containing protein [Solirubrobacteraceae bacterium]
MPVTTEILPNVIARDAMRSPIISCTPDAPLAEVAALMATNRVHCVITEGLTLDRRGERLTWGVVSDLDLVRGAAANDPHATAGTIAATLALTVDADETLASVAAALAAYDCSHVIVVEGDQPVGLISTLDLASVLAQ